MKSSVVSVRLLLFSVISVLACAPLTAQQVSTDQSGSAGNYILASNDLVDIRVFREDDLRTIARVAKDGTISFPLIGIVRIGGMTVLDASKTIRDLLEKDYLVNPQVNVTVREYSKRSFTILGQVQKAGSYDFPDNRPVDLLQAIAMAGGYTRIADPGKITLKRRAPDGKEAIIRVDAKRMAKEESSKPFEILPGDTITVGESIF